MRMQYKYLLKYIGNMDETPIWFELPSNTTINKKEEKTVSIHITGHERTSFTVILECMTDDIKLPAIYIFKLKKIPKEKFLNSIYICVNEKIQFIIEFTNYYYKMNKRVNLLFLY